MVLFLPKHKAVERDWFCIMVLRLVAIKIRKSVLTDGLVDITKIRPIAKLVYHQEYGVIVLFL